MGTPQRLDKPTKERQSKLIQDISNDQFAKFLASDLGTRATDPQFEDIFIAINSLHLHEQNDETLELYKDILTDPYKRHDHKHVIKLLQTDEALSKELAKLKKSTYEFKLLQTTGQKIKVLRQIEATYNIGFLIPRTLKLYIYQPPEPKILGLLASRSFAPRTLRCWFS